VAELRWIKQLAGRHGLCMEHRECLVKDNVVGVSHTASGVDQDAKNGRGCRMVTKKAYINRLRLKLLLVLAWCNHKAWAAKGTQCVQRWGMSVPEFIRRGVVSVDLGRSDFD